ncbi:carboxymuconolactone decarboxylase family protein [Jeotgalibacillus soli]|uniref:Alkylhydroperoxidase n=1 Tax=Jeotgalibacillus soli TaxID=889306 RepID=A0A0C2VMY9_9BACL|nr:carboxymuconolactone decarboxylase family protein [Jeotgalibacillus soli]KIL45368.1 alkylhydroperoxidase [Jeotgalibacillus soli]
MSNSLYQKENLKSLNQLKNLVPNQLHAFSEFNSNVLKEGALTRKEKELIAIAIAHVTECPYCIDIHTRSAKSEGATLEELVEAVFVVSGVEAGGVVSHSTHITNALNPDADDALYGRSNLKNINYLKKGSPDGYKAYSEFSSSVMKEGQLSTKFKEIIAVAVAHATQCPYCIEIHVKNAEKNGASHEELSEAILVASALLAGGSYAHITNLIQAYND